MKTIRPNSLAGQIADDFSSSIRALSAYSEIDATRADVAELIATRIADTLHKRYPALDRSEFIKACGVRS